MNILCMNEHQLDFFSKPMEPVFSGGYQGTATQIRHQWRQWIAEEDEANYVPVMKGQFCLDC